MKKYINILETIDVYDTHEPSSKIIKQLQPGELVTFTREKRRNGINWMEINLENEGLAYLKKEPRKIYICDYVYLSDEKAVGFGYRYKTEDQPPFNFLFLPIGSIDRNNHSVETITLRSQNDEENKKYVELKLEYPSDLVEVWEINFKKDDHFYVMKKTLDRNDVFIEVDDFKDSKGFILKKTNYNSQKDAWMGPVAIIASIGTIGAIIIAFLMNGWLVVSKLMIIPAIIVAFIAIFAIQIVLVILSGIFSQIRKRL